MELNENMTDSGITVHDDGSISAVKDGVTTYAILWLYNGLLLECRCPGLKMSRRVSALQSAKRLYNLTGRAPKVFRDLGNKLADQGYITHAQHAENLAKIGL